ncbi:MAG: ubiquinone-binding protein [Rickettsiales bacterium]|nr:MAG: ubiquinone-binding protein [Rickettsiales bacterium]
MNSFQETRLVPYKADLIHEIIMGIEQYPEFLPWCDKASILERHDEFITAELGVNFKGFSEGYVSEVRSSKTDDGYVVSVRAISGIFKHLENKWSIKNVNNGSEVSFSIDFEFKSKILDGVMGMIFSLAIEKIIVSFESRAEELSRKLV